MWIWILLMALANQNFVSSMEELQEEVPDDSMYLYLEERSLKDPADIEARRRSALDKNFMRFGRGGNDYILQKHILDPEDVDESEDEYSRDQRTLHNKNGNFIRFGRGKAGDFIRFGRNPSSYFRESRGHDRNIIRFGRSLDQHRSKRQTNDDEFLEEYKRRTNNMLRFGRANNFMRFGRFPQMFKEIKSEVPQVQQDVQEDKDNQPQVHRQKINSPMEKQYIPLNYWPLLQNYAAGLRFSKQICNSGSNCPRRQN